MAYKREDFYTGHGQMVLAMFIDERGRTHASLRRQRDVFPSVAFGGTSGQYDEGTVHFHSDNIVLGGAYFTLSADARTRIQQWLRDNGVTVEIDDDEAGV